MNNISWSPFLLWNMLSELYNRSNFCVMTSIPSDMKDLIRALTKKNTVVFYKTVHAQGMFSVAAI